MTNKQYNRLDPMLPARRDACDAGAGRLDGRRGAGATGGRAARPPRCVEPRASAAALSYTRRPVTVWLWLALLLFVAFISTVLLRGSNMNRAFDIFVDEGVYLSLSQSVTEGLRPSTYLTNFTSDVGPFYLHPPAFFYTEAAFLDLLQPGGNMVQQIYAARWVNVLFAGLTAMLLFLLGRNVAGTVAGIAAALIFAADPWVIRIDSRNLIETSATFWIVLGYCLLVYYIRRPRSTWLAIGAGLAFGIAALSKDPTVFLTLLPLAICFTLGWAIPRRIALLVASITCLVYAVYVLAVTLAGDLPLFLFQKSGGVRRLAGEFDQRFFYRRRWTFVC